MSLRAMKGLARTPPGSLKIINTGKREFSRVSTIHSRARLLTGAMGVPLMCEDIVGSNPMNIYMVEDTGDSWRPNAVFCPSNYVHGHAVGTMEGGL